MRYSPRISQLVPVRKLEVSLRKPCPTDTRARIEQNQGKATI